MNKLKAYSYFNSTFTLKEGGNGWMYFVNPFDPKALISGKMKMCVNFVYGKVKCWSTGYKASIMQFIKEYEDVDYKVAKELVEDFDETSIDLSIKRLDTYERKDVLMPAGYRSILEGDGVLGNRARKYLQKRGFDLDKLDEDGFGYCMEESDDYKESYYGYILIPFKIDGKLKYFIGRDFLDRDPKYKYKNPATEKFGIGKSQLLYNEDALHFEDEVFVTEGWADAETAGSNGIATLGWDLSPYQYEKMLLSDVDSFIFLHDYGFRKETVKCAMKFIGMKKVYVPDLDPLMHEDCKDVNDLARTKKSKKRFLKHIEENKVELTRSLAIKILSE